MGIGIKHYSLMMSLARPFKIQNGMDFSLSHLMVVNYPKKGVRLDLASQLWLPLKGLPFVKTIYAHFIVIIQFSRSLFHSRYLFYSWFNQFEGSSSMDLVIL
jgi:hypothetical protein